MKKQKSPMELNTGEELYDYLNGKTEQEIEDYFVSRGAEIINGTMFNNGLYLLYKIEKKKREESTKPNGYDDDFDGLER